MRAGQWVAFDASTEKPHKCGKKNKEDPNIKELAKQKNKIQETENVDLGYESEIDLEIVSHMLRFASIEMAHGRISP